MDARPLTPGVTPHPLLPLHALDGAPVSEPLRRSEAPRIRYFIAGFARAQTVGWESHAPTVGMNVAVDTTQEPVPAEEEEQTPVAVAAEPEEVTLLAKTAEPAATDEPAAADEPAAEAKEEAKADDAATIVEKVAELDVKDNDKPAEDTPPPPPPASEKRRSTLTPAEDVPPPPPPARDPFKKDIFDLGQLYAREFTDVRTRPPSPVR